MHTRGREEAWEVARRVLTLTLVVLGTIAVLGALLAPQIMRFYYADSPGVPPEQIALGIYLLRWFMPQIVFYGIGAVAGGLLNAHRRFAAPMFAPILNNLAVIATMIVFATLHHGAPHDRVAHARAEDDPRARAPRLGVVAMTLALWPSLRSVGFRWHLRFDWGHEAVRRLARLASWVVVYVVANQIAFVVVLRLSARHESWFTIYTYAFILFSLPHAIFAVSIFTALLPRMSRIVGERRRRRPARSALPRASATCRSSRCRPRWATWRSRIRSRAWSCSTGSSRPRAPTSTARVLQAFALGLPFFSAFQLFTRTFYAMQDSRTPALVNVAAAVVNVAANLFFLNVAGWGVVGLALGHATSYVFSSAVCLILLRRRLRGIEAASIVATLSRVVPAAILTALAAFGVAELLEQHPRCGQPAAADRAGGAGRSHRAACVRGLGIYLRHPGGR